jgi:hypothetical protein
MSVQITNGIFDQNELDIRYEVRLPILKDQNCRPRPPHHPEEPEHKPEHPHKPPHPCPSNNYIKISGYVDCVGRLPMVVDKNEIWLVGSEMYIYLGINKGDKGTPNVAWKLLGSIAHTDYITRDERGNLLPLATLTKSGFMSAIDKQVLTELVNLGLTLNNEQLAPVASETFSGFMSPEDKSTLNKLSQLELNKVEGQLTPIATEDSNGFLSAEDKRKLDSIKPNNEYIPIEWRELKILLTQGNLTPGAIYRLTDYEFTPADLDNYRHSPDVRFDLLITAISNNALGDQCITMSSNPNLDGLFVKYNLTNDTEKFELANGEIVHLYALDVVSSKIGPKHPLTAMAYGNGIYVAISEGYSYVSKDLISWTSHELIDRSCQWNDIIFIDDKFLVCGYSGIIAQSTDGIEWDEVPNSYGEDTEVTSNYKTFVKYNGVICIIPTMSDRWLCYSDGEVHRYYGGFNVSFNKCITEDGNIIFLADSTLMINNNVYNLPVVDGSYVDLEYIRDGVILITDCGKGYYTQDLTNYSEGFIEFEIPQHASSILTRNGLTYITCTNHSDKLYRLDYIEDESGIRFESSVDHVIAMGSYRRIYYFNNKFYLLATNQVGITNLYSNEVGKGVIYEMSDRYGNTLRYDYKSAQIKYYKNYIEGEELVIDYDWKYTFNVKDTNEDASNTGLVDGVVQGLSLDNKGKRLFEFNVFELGNGDYITNLEYVKFERNFIGCTIKDVVISPKTIVSECKFKDLFNIVINCDILNCIATEPLRNITFNGGRLVNRYLDNIYNRSNHTENPITITTKGDDTYSTISWLDNETQATQYRKIFGLDQIVGSGGYDYYGGFGGDNPFAAFIGTI